MQNMYFKPKNFLEIDCSCQPVAGEKPAWSLVQVLVFCVARGKWIRLAREATSVGRNQRGGGG